jgi:tRNA(fMet)-specific endonuclease VapC
MNGRYLLDTNIIIALFADEAVVKVSFRGAAEIFVPSIALGELYYGAHKSKRSIENLARIENFAQQSVVLSCNQEASRSYGKIKHQLRKKGRPIPENDIWIAAIALQHDLTLVTRDVHFQEVEGLKIEAW